MKPNPVRTNLKVLALLLAGGAFPAAQASGGGPMPSLPQSAPRVSPERQARDLYNDGVYSVKRADQADADAAQQSDAGKKQRSLRDAHDRYANALEKFKGVLAIDPQRSDAWNYAGYTSRKLGNYDDALYAYEKALALKPGYPDAIEYRGEAYLALDRVADAKQSYLDLFAGNRALADKLLSAMKGWVAAQRSATAGGDAAGADELDKWIQERSQIAAQTASLTRAGTISAWR